jgi:KUP system potassium uptake protein
VAMLHNIKLNRVLHQKNVILTVITAEVPYVSEGERADIEALGGGFHRVVIRYGFMEDPDIPNVLRDVRIDGAAVDLATTTYVLSNNTLLAGRDDGMALWRKRLFAFLSRNALRPTQFFRLPTNRVVELGMQIEI